MFNVQDAKNYLNKVSETVGVSDAEYFGKEITYNSIPVKKKKKKKGRRSQEILSTVREEGKMRKGIRIIPTKRGRKIIQNLMNKKTFKEYNHLELERELTSEYNRMKPKNTPTKFQHPRGTTLVIFDEGSNEILRCKGHIPKKKINRLASRYPNATVMVDLGNGLYKQIPLRTFKRLTKIKYIMFERSYEFYGIDEYEPLSRSGDWFVPDNVVDHIYSINQLLKVFVIEEAYDKANEVYLTARFYDLTGVDKECKILFNSGKVKKMSYDEFNKKYEVDISIRFFDEKRFKKKSKKNSSTKYKNDNPVKKKLLSKSKKKKK